MEIDIFWHYQNQLIGISHKFNQLDQRLVWSNW